MPDFSRPCLASGPLDGIEIKTDAAEESRIEHSQRTYSIARTQSQNFFRWWLQRNAYIRNWFGCLINVRLILSKMLIGISLVSSNGCFLAYEWFCFENGAVHGTVGKHQGCPRIHAKENDKNRSVRKFPDNRDSCVDVGVPSNSPFRRKGEQISYEQNRLYGYLCFYLFEPCIVTKVGINTIKPAALVASAKVKINAPRSSLNLPKVHEDRVASVFFFPFFFLFITRLLSDDLNVETFVLVLRAYFSWWNCARRVFKIQLYDTN